MANGLVATAAGCSTVARAAERRPATERPESASRAVIPIHGSRLASKTSPSALIGPDPGSFTRSRRVPTAMSWWSWPLGHSLGQTETYWAVFGRVVSAAPALMRFVSGKPAI
jgi:hypothetical protein